MAKDEPLKDDWTDGDTIHAADVDDIATSVNDEANQRTLGDAYRELQGYRSDITSAAISGSTPDFTGAVFWESSLNSGAPLPWRYCGVEPVELTGNAFIGINNNNSEGQNAWYQPIVIEFWSNATTINVFSFMAAKPDVWALVDDQRITYVPQHYNGADGETTWTLTVTGAVMRKWRISIMSNFIGLSTNSGAKIVPTTPGFQLLVVGDSYVQGGISTNNAVSSGTAGTISSGSIWGEFEQITGLDIWRAGIIGSGYINQASLSTVGPYGSTQRLAAIAAMPAMDAIVVFGSVNDDASSASTVAAAATACWTALAAAQPGAPIIVVGPECMTGGPSSGATANNAALKTAAEAHTAVVAYIDMLEHSIITGTGFDGGAVGDGNADVFISGDETHPTHAGMKYWAEHLARLLAPVEFQSAPWGGTY